MKHQTAEFTKSSGDIPKLLEWLRDAENSTPETEWRDTATEDYKFYAGRQDSDTIKATLEDQNRPTNVYNEIKPKIDMLIGMAAQTKHQVLAEPVGIEDEALAELMNGMLMFERKELKLSEKELSCFVHVTKSGRSLLYFYIDKSNPFAPEIRAARISGYCFYVDPNSVEMDLSDARYVFIDKWLPEEDIKALWPDKNVHELQSGQDSDMPTFFNEASDLYRVVEGWYRKIVEVVWFVNPLTGAPESLEKKEFGEFNKTLKEGIRLPNGREVKIPEGVEGIPGFKQKIYYSVFSGTLEFESGESPYNMDLFPMALLGAYKDDDYNSWFGAITMMKDPQKGINAMRRQLSHMLQTLPKGMLRHESGAILNIEEYETDSSKPNFHLEIAPGKFDKVAFDQQPQVPQIYQTFGAEMQQGMKDASGIQNEMMGVQTTSREAGVSVRLRQETSVSVLYLIFENYRQFRFQATKILMYLTQQYITYPMVVRIQGQLGQKLIEVNTQLNPQVSGYNDIAAIKYDLVLDDNPETASSRIATAELLTEYSHNNPNVIPPDLILDFANVPYMVKQRIRQSFEEQKKMAALQAEHEMQMQQREMQLKEIELQIKVKELELKWEEMKSKEKIENKKVEQQKKTAASKTKSGGKVLKLSRK